VINASTQWLSVTRSLIELFVDTDEGIAVSDTTLLEFLKPWGMKY